jgi:hypothetical protein
LTRMQHVTYAHIAEHNQNNHEQQSQVFESNRFVIAA